MWRWRHQQTSEVASAKRLTVDASTPGAQPRRRPWAYLESTTPLRSFLSRSRSTAPAPGATGDGGGAGACPGGFFEGAKVLFHGSVVLRYALCDNLDARAARRAARAARGGAALRFDGDTTAKGKKKSSSESNWADPREVVAAAATVTLRERRACGCTLWLARVALRVTRVHCHQGINLRPGVAQLGLRRGQRRPHLPARLFELALPRHLALHGFLPTAGGPVRDPNPLAGSYDGPRDGPRTSHYIWDIMTGGPLFGDNPDVVRRGEFAVIDPRSRGQFAADEAERRRAREAAENRTRAKRRLHPIAQSVKRPRR